MLINILIVLFIILIFYQLLFQNSLFNYFPIIESMTNEESPEEPNDESKDEPKAETTNKPSENTTTEVKSYNTGSNNALILAQENAGNIQVIKQQIDKTLGLDNQIKQMRTDLDALTEQVNGLTIG